MLLLSHDCKPKACFLMWSCQLRMKWIWVETNKKIQFRNHYFLEKNHFPILYTCFRLSPCKPQESDVYQISSTIFQFWKGRVSFWETFVHTMHTMFLISGLKIYVLNTYFSTNTTSNIWNYWIWNEFKKFLPLHSVLVSPLGNWNAVYDLGSFAVRFFALHCLCCGYYIVT